MATHSASGGMTGPERRRAHGAAPARMDKAGGTVAVLAGVLLLLPNLAWIVAVIGAVISGDSSPHMLVTVPFPILLVLVALLLLDLGLGRLRGALSWLDRRRRA